MIEPSELIGWYPPPRESSIKNLEWVSDDKYDRIADYLGGRIHNKIMVHTGLKNITPLSFRQSIHRRLQEPIYHKELCLLQEKPSKDLMVVPASNDMCNSHQSIITQIMFSFTLRFSSKVVLVLMTKQATALFLNFESSQ